MLGELGENDYLDSFLCFLELIFCYSGIHIAVAFYNKGYKDGYENAMNKRQSKRNELIKKEEKENKENRERKYSVTVSELISYLRSLTCFQPINMCNVHEPIMNDFEKTHISNMEWGKKFHYMVQLLYNIPYNNYDAINENSPTFKLLGVKDTQINKIKDFVKLLRETCGDPGSLEESVRSDSIRGRCDIMTEKYVIEIKCENTPGWETWAQVQASLYRALSSKNRYIVYNPCKGVYFAGGSKDNSNALKELENWLQNR